MAQYIKQADIFGRLGSGLGQGLSEQLPKEIERTRLSSGLKKFADNSQNLTPIQQLANVSAIPGITPQAIQSFGELAKQQARGNALGANGSVNQNSGSVNQFPASNGAVNENVPSQRPSTQKEEHLAEAQKGYIPPTYDQIVEDAGRDYNRNPALYGNDPQRAIDAAVKRVEQNEKVQIAHEAQNEKLKALEENVKNGFRSYSNQLGIKVPANVYTDFEDKVIQKIKPKKDGGEGKTENQAIKEVGGELDRVSRDYSQVRSVTGLGALGRSPKDTIRSLSDLQRKFESRNDTENLADTIIAEQKVQAPLAYAIAEPVSREPKLNEALKSAPRLKQVPTLFEDKTPESVSKPATEEIAKKLAPLLGKKGSPLAVAYELEKKGYDPNVWLGYLSKNQNKLGLSARQATQLGKNKNLFGTIYDWWFSSWTGLDEDKEVK